MKYFTLLVLTFFNLTVSGQLNSKLLADLNKAPNDTSKVRIYGKLAAYYMFAKPDSANYYCSEGLKLAKSLNSKFGEALILGQLASTNVSHSNFTVAKKYYEEALQLFVELNDAIAVANIKNSLGIVEGRNGNFKIATNLFLEALSIFKKYNDVNGIIQSYIKLGTVNDINGNIDKALEYFTLANNLNKDTTNNAYFTLLNNLGINAARRGNFEKAISFFEKAIKSSENHPQFVDIYISNLNNCMKAYSEMGNKSKALAYHKLVLAKAKEIQLHDEEARALYNFATYEVKTNPQIAITYLEQAINIQEKNGGNPDLTISIYGELSKAYKYANRFEDGYNALEKYYNLKDSFFNITKSRELANMFSDFELKEAKNQVEELELTNAKRTAERNIVIVAIIAVFSIIVILLRNKNKLEKLNTQLTETNRVKDKLFSIIGHDLKGPIGNIVQLLELISNKELSEEEQESLVNEVKKQTNVTNETLNDLLTWGQAQLKGVMINPVVFNAKDIIQQNIHVLATQASSKQIYIEDTTSENTLLKADKNQLDFVFRNLISNAIKFSNNNGKVEISNTTKNNEVVFAVKDFGKGISKEDQQQFVQSNIKVSYGTSGEKGTGLGLMLTKEFIKANNGKIWLESEEGIGTTFYISLPKA